MRCGNHKFVMQGQALPATTGSRNLPAREKTMKKSKGLRSRLAQYGDEEFALFLRRGFLKGAGYTDNQLDLPIVGILSTASDFNPCHGTEIGRAHV